MGIARSTCYQASKGSADDTALVETMHAIKDEFEAYGWRRMDEWLARANASPERGMVPDARPVRGLAAATEMDL